MTAHTIIALAIQSVIWCLFGDPFYGAFAASWYFVGREYAQAEQRVIHRFYGNRRALAPVWCGLEPRAWTLKGVFDWIIPTAVVFSIATVCHFGHLPLADRSVFISQWTPSLNLRN